jgi:hypothetical protein
VPMMSGPSTLVTREQVHGMVGLAWNGSIQASSIEVVNVAGDSVVGRDRIQSAPNLRRVHAESVQ